MAKKKKSDKNTAIALITQIIILITALLNLVTSIIKSLQ